MKWLRWDKGRQETGYEKLLLAYCKFPTWMCVPVLGFDLYLLWYPEGSEIPEHADNVKGFRHYRINVVLKKCVSGGIFKTDFPILNWKRLKIFRSDRPHSVTRITRGTRLLLSFGTCLKE
jgi:hypothetical protein